MGKRKPDKVNFLRIKAVLEEKGKTQAWLADAIGKDIVSISRYVNGHREPSLSVLFEIAKVLKVKPGELLAG